MITAEAPNAADTDVYDPEDVGPRDSPPLRALKPKLAPTPSPSLEGGPQSDSEESTPPGTPGKSRKYQKRLSKKSVATRGDALLINTLANGKAPEVGHIAGQQILPSVSDDDEMETAEASHKAIEVTVESTERPTDLAALAAGALRAFNGTDTTTSFGFDSAKKSDLSDDPSRHISTKTSSTNGNHDHELAPIQVSSPQAEKVNSLTLPSISAQLGDLGDLKHLADATTSNVDKGANSVHRPSFSQSPPQPPLFQMRDSNLGSSHTSPPISPNKSFSRELPSPGRGGPSGNAYYYNPRRPSQVAEGPPYSSTPVDYSSSTTETPNTDPSGSTPCGIPAGIDRMSIDGITNPQIGGFQCTYPGCSAQPFQTQYLLNSHANVHSSNRPHYCPVKGCPRSEGGKGFKRKNEMIRHGLVHESPGYVCPYCVDREHKYPRPDNLQR
jgi:hypothetical protein